MSPKLSNDQVLLNSLLQQRRETVASEESESDFFELFVAGEILKDYDLSYEEIESGAVGRGNDGGIDSIYCFVNGEVITDDTDPDDFKRDITVRLIIIQSKIHAGFSEEIIHKFIATSQDILNLSCDLDGLEGVYNNSLLRVARNFRRVYTALISRHPKLNITYYAATKGTEVHPNTERKVDALKQVVATLFSPCQFSFEFLDARKLLDLAQQSPKTSLKLQLAENPISAANEAFLCLVRLKDFYSFITDSAGTLRRNIFEANVRDYQGSAEVNAAIKATLDQHTAPEDFWWLNNGITIVASRTNHASKALTIEDAQIVNGLQTSTEVYEYFRDHPDVADDRNILVRVIAPDDDTSRDKIIRATNSQTSIPVASLRATDKIQRDIEEYFASKGFYYDRRKSYYKNAGRPKDKIISIPYLAQAVMAIILQEPNNSRARPSSLLKEERDYNRVFDVDYPLEAFFRCAAFMKRIDDFMRSSSAGFAAEERSNVKFHLAMFASAMAVGKVRLKAADLQDDALEGVELDVLLASLTSVWSVFEALKEEQGVPSDRIAKGPAFVDALKRRIAQDVARKGDVRKRVVEL